MSLRRPALLTFDIFGTVVDWRRGLVDACVEVGGVARERAAASFDAMVDAQGRLEQAKPGRRYRTIVAEAASVVLGIDAPLADAVAATVGRWPPYPDSTAALARLARVAPLVALTNSDSDQGAEVRAALGGEEKVPWHRWLCAEETGIYKPDPRAWEACRAATNVAEGDAWWHVSAYADYDLDEARRRGLTTVYVERPHRRPGPATHVVKDLAALADLLEA
jgi:putative hydrolase of the HAD superfamily